MIDDSGKKIILYNYCRTRSTEHLRNFLSAYQGTLVSDGYQPYHTFSEEQALASAGCWRHCRRRFVNAIKAAQKDLEKVKIEDEVTDVICDVCGRNMVVKYGPHGKFLACPGFPECRNTKPYLEKIGVTCPKCGKEVVLRKTKKGRKYFGCEDNPECDFMSWSRPVAEKCPKCGGYMVIKGNKIVCADEQCGYVTDRKNVEKDSE